MCPDYTSQNEFLDYRPATIELKAPCDFYMENSYLTFIENTWNINTERERKRQAHKHKPSIFH